MVIAFAFNLGMPSTDLKLVSAVIVTIALSTGMLGERFSIPALMRKSALRRGGGTNA
jgi:putative ABC transport system permease protein